MSVRFKQELDNIKRRCNCALDDLLPEEIEDLADACHRVDNPYSGVNANLIEKPIFVARGVYGWPVTCGASIWLTEYAERWWSKKDRMYAFAQVYAIMNARDPDAFVNLTDRAKARNAVLKCCLKLAVHGCELQSIVDQAYGIVRGAPPTKREIARQKSKARVEAEIKDDFATIIARLEVSSGIYSRVWLWEKSMQDTVRAYIEMRHLANAVMTGRLDDDASPELDEAIANLARVKAHIIERLETVA